MDMNEFALDSNELLLAGKKHAKKLYLIIWGLLSLVCFGIMIGCSIGIILYYFNDTVQGSEAVPFILNLLLLFFFLMVGAIGEVAVSIAMFLIYKRTDYVKFEQKRLAKSQK